MPEEKVCIYIDGSNLYHSLKNTCGRTNLDFAKFCQKLTGGRKLIRTYYYNAPVDQAKEATRYADQQRFFNYVESLAYTELRLGRLVYRNWSKGEPPYEKGVDVRLATDMLVHAVHANYDTAILVSQDTDFADAVQALKDWGKQVEVALFGSGRTSQRLRTVADKVVTITPAFLNDCWR